MKDWVITIGIDKFYLTEEQKDFYLSAISKGQDYVALDDNKILGKNFQSIVHVSTLDEKTKYEERKWQCESGNWHNLDTSCYCKAQLTQSDGISKFRIEGSTGWKDKIQVQKALEAKNENDNS